MRAVNEGEVDLSQDLAKSCKYTLQLERQLRELLQSPQGSGKSGVSIWDKAICDKAICDRRLGCRVKLCFMCLQISREACLAR